MASPQNPNNIWAQMSYTPPRGSCHQKLSLLTSCPCHRFMIHPLKASTSFDCDGCGHHASFHSMQNQSEEDTARRWRKEQEEEVRSRERERWRSVEEVMEAFEGGDEARGGRGLEIGEGRAGKRKRRLELTEGREEEDGGVEEVVEFFEEREVGNGVGSRGGSVSGREESRRIGVGVGAGRKRKGRT